MWRAHLNNQNESFSCFWFVFTRALKTALGKSCGVGAQLLQEMKLSAVECSQKSFEFAGYKFFFFSLTPKTSR